jgi:hypothetical protein
MCSTPKAKPTPTPDLLITRRDGEASSQAAARRKQGNLRLDLNSARNTSGLTIPRG